MTTVHRNALIATASVLAAYAIFAGRLLAVHGEQPGALVTAGDQFVDRREAPPSLQVAPHSAGYDGQFYYRLALSPLSSRPVDHGIRFDYPVYRQQRILDPILAWIASGGGQPSLVPSALIAINLVALACIGGIGAMVAMETGAPAWMGGIVAFYPGFLLSLSRDCVEIVEVAFVLGGLYCFQRRRFAVSAILLTLAALTKETALLAAVGLALSTLLPSSGIRRRVGLAIALMPIAAQMIWKGILFHIWNVAPSLGVNGLSIPFSGYVLALPPAIRSNSFFAAEMLLLLAFWVMALIALGKPRLREAVLPFLLYTILASTLSAYVWSEDWSFLRVSSELWCFGSLIILGSRPAMRWTLVGATAACWVVLAANVLTR